MMIMSKSKIAAIYLFLFILLAAGHVWGTTVTMSTNMGNIAVELFDDVAPKTVANFLNYVNDGDYTNTIIHRSVPGFIIQGGGFTINGTSIQYVPADPPVENEFSISNTRGTIAMAKLGGDPNSATNQWFFNLADNSGDPANLDTQNGGFTVFGRASAQSMDVIDAIAALPIYDESQYLNAAFGALPLLDDLLSAENLVTITRITINAGPGYGDIDGDGNVSLADTILILKTLSGVDYALTIPQTADLDGDGKIGMKEAIYTLQVISGIISE
ncbi:MAG: peptidylprolyl isomerase [Deltaproteobacteria bacterium]|nr:peptidylprolyl isomerase [Deltaproteobacteria bacterium]